VENDALHPRFGTHTHPSLVAENLWNALGELGVEKDVVHPHFGKGKEAMHKLEAARCVCVCDVCVT
jgi:hypothetical protein